MNNFLESRLSDVAKASMDLDYELATEFAKKIMEMRDSNNKMIFIGNGASETIANHAALDYMNQTGVYSVCVNDPAVLTAFSNDFGYDRVFERFVRMAYKEGDILVAVSSSGNSPNVVNAVKYVEEIGGNAYCFSGFSNDNALMQTCKNNFWVDSKVYNVVESIHNLWLAMICDQLIEWMGAEVGVHGLNVGDM
jgi:D-sedoheptulose 7-phosphate isomerase